MDWLQRENVWAEPQLIIKQTLRKYKYPPNLQEEAVVLIVLKA